MIGHFRSQIADEAAWPILELARHDIELVKIGLQTKNWRYFLVLKHLQGVRRSLPVTFQRFDAERFLALEMVVKRTLGNAGRLGDILHARCIESPLMQHFQSCSKDRFFETLSRHRFNMTDRLSEVKMRGSVSLIVHRHP